MSGRDQWTSAARSHVNGLSLSDPVQLGHGRMAPMADSLTANRWPQKPQSAVRWLAQWPSSSPPSAGSPKSHSRVAVAIRDSCVSGGPSSVHMAR